MATGTQLGYQSKPVALVNIDGHFDWVSAMLASTGSGGLTEEEDEKIFIFNRSVRGILDDLAMWEAIKPKYGAAVSNGHRREIYLKGNRLQLRAIARMCERKSKSLKKQLDTMEDGSEINESAKRRLEVDWHWFTKQGERLCSVTF